MRRSILGGGSDGDSNITVGVRGQECFGSFSGKRGAFILIPAVTVPHPSGAHGPFQSLIERDEIKTIKRAIWSNLQFAGFVYLKR